MRSLMTTILIAAALLPAAAQAQSQAELDRDHREVRQDRRELDRDRRQGDYRDVRADRRDLREDRRDLQGDRNRRWARDDWRAWRDRNPAFYAGGGWRAPFRYTAFRPGVRIAPLYFGPQFVIAEPWRYHLPPADGATRWVRHYNDVLLVDYRRGVVVDVIRGFYR